MTFREAAPGWARIAAHHLGWRPDDFWQATPAELMQALRSPDTIDGASAPTRELIQNLMERDKYG